MKILVQTYSNYKNIFILGGLWLNLNVGIIYLNLLYYNFNSDSLFCME